MAPTSVHPAQRFEAPTGIKPGVALKDVLNSQLITLVGESIAAILPRFDRRQFARQANAGLDAMEFSQRGQHIGRTLAEQLPRSFADQCEILIRAMGPELTATEGNGLGVFFYLPHSHVIAQGGTELSQTFNAGNFEAGMSSIYELTKRMTGEFCIRPFVIAQRERCLKVLSNWANDPNPHVRRLVSEGTRPRLPWAIRLKEFQRHPHFTLPLLELLKDDEELYVRRSVANHLADVLKDHPDAAYDLCDRWLAEVTSTRVPAERASARRWIIRHAVRLPAKKGHPRALALRQQSQ